ncbi:hypothetical protein COLO4_23974 [Corchorus olitorius]|uniref:Uncharacterized protein n=1 Tax=Corchorus olitorius TaxID=93759 RepID=A0A1R3IDN7_9ROSI|nr:hypothetical protein COLO4_23974 [Corchorus olitorius]
MKGLGKGEQEASHHLAKENEKVAEQAARKTEGGLGGSQQDEHVNSGKSFDVENVAKEEIEDVMRFDGGYNSCEETDFEVYIPDDEMG